MPNEWYVAVSGTQTGPLSTAQLRILVRDKKLRPTDLIWYKGLKDWASASRVKGLFPAEPPPLPQNENGTGNNDVSEHGRPNSRNPSSPVAPSAVSAPAPEPTSNDDSHRESFADWHKRRLSLVHWLPTFIRWVIIGLLWTYGCGFVWLPIWYLFDTAEGPDLVAKIRSIGTRIPGGQCPDCKKNWVREVIRKELIGSGQGYQTVTRYDEHISKRPGNFFGTKVGETRREEQVVVTINSYVVTCRCKQCGHTWNETLDESSGGGIQIDGTRIIEGMGSLFGKGKKADAPPLPSGTKPSPSGTKPSPSGTKPPPSGAPTIAQLQEMRSNIEQRNKDIESIKSQVASSRIANREEMERLKSKINAHVCKQIENLLKMLTKGQITQQEFDEKKAALLNRL